MKNLDTEDCSYAFIKHANNQYLLRSSIDFLIRTFGCIGLLINHRWRRKRLLATTCLEPSVQDQSEHESKKNVALVKALLVRE